jgi:hypothetical protein
MWYQTRRDALRGLDFDFLVLDSQSHVAVVTSNGSGPIPTAVLSMSLDARDSWESLPIIGSVESLEQIPHLADVIADPNSFWDPWHRAAFRGLYGRDWITERETYDWVTKPTVAMLASESFPIERARLCASSQRANDPSSSPIKVVGILSTLPMLHPGQTPLPRILGVTDI